MSVLTIVGCGPGDPALLSPMAAAAIAAAEQLVGSERLLRDFAPGRAGRLCPARRSQAQRCIQTCLQTGDVCLLVSGDPGCFSLAAAMRDCLPPAQIRVIPGISSVQLACARLGCDWSRARILSAHGREPDADPRHLTDASLIVVLLGGDGAWPWLLRCRQSLADSHQAWLCQALSLPGERVERFDPDEHAPAPLQIAVFIAQNNGNQS